MEEIIQLPRSIGNFTDIQIKIFDLRAKKYSLRKICYEISTPLPELEEEDHEEIVLQISPNAVRTSLKWIVQGHRWKPHKKGGSHKLFNLDDGNLLLEWAEETQPSANAFLEKATEILNYRAQFAAQILITLDLPKIAEEVLNEVKGPSRQWINVFLEGTDYNLKSPESIDLLRFKHVTKGSVTRWFEDYGG